MFFVTYKINSFPIDPLSVDEVRTSMSVSNGCDILLALAWITGKEISMLDRFPEVSFADVTECTNKERRGMFVCTGQDGNDNIFKNALHFYMPNGKPQTFDCIYLEAKPKLVGKSIIKGNRVLLITDCKLAMYTPHRENTRDLHQIQMSLTFLCRHDIPP